ncbi:hypothetical protein C1T17_05780 [Sphingobium sp. SCG-1]|uniref:PaaI family thioesterase n=1 Tax=Sphingobium sp. SCG-1 TaxID=2072936 RepID=UPI000CD6AC6A|nr:PaaI family thioesterase [Sphingobium sp. SCG-1]AUW57686.1 hypothetical protein C1T17_05780 [Sphingobium sp. SCG-1]
MTDDVSDQEWRIFDVTESGTWWDDLPAVSYRQSAADRIDFRMQPSEQSGNRLGGLHGGFLAGFAEGILGLFLTVANGLPNCVTVSLSFDYPGSGRVGLPVEGQLYLVRETGRMQFVRVVLEQEGVTLLYGNGVLRKLNLP